MGKTLKIKVIGKNKYKQGPRGKRSFSKGLLVRKGVYIEWNPVNRSQ
jgi:hypothetical protein